MEALEYADKVLINAPFSREIRDFEYMNDLKDRLREKKVRLTVVWVITNVDVMKERMMDRNSDRDTWKIENWDEYIKTVDLAIPKALDDPKIVDDLLLFLNSSDEEYQDSMERILRILEEEEVETT